MPDDAPRRAIRLEDVAREAGVSAATVSYALGGNKGVSEATRQRIVKIASDMGYVPNRQAAALRAHRSYILGCVVPDIRNPFFSQIVHGLESAAATRGYRLMLCVTEDDPADEARHLQMLLEHHVDGLLLVPVARSQDGDYPNLNLLRAFQRRQIPILCLVDSVRELSSGRVTTAVYQGTRLILDHLIQLGHRDIAYFSQPFHRVVRLGRHDAYQDSLRAAGIPYRADLMIETGLTPDDAYRQTGLLLDRKVPFTAAVYANDYMAIGGLRMLRERGLRVPQDVSVTGFDDVEWARFCEVPLTTARFAIQQLGEIAVREIVDYLALAGHTADVVFCDISLSPTLVPRQSTAAPGR